MLFIYTAQMPRPRHYEPTIRRTLGPRVRTQRSEVGLSLRELARKLGISPSALSSIETGKTLPTVSTLLAIARELRTPLDALLPPPAPGAPPRAGRARLDERSSLAR